MSADNGRSSNLGQSPALQRLGKDIADVTDRVYTDLPHAPLSATEREQQRIAYIAAVDNMATTLIDLRNYAQATTRVHASQLDALGRAYRIAQDRLDALERAEAVRRSSSFLARLRWLVGL